MSGDDSDGLTCWKIKLLCLAMLVCSPCKFHICLFSFLIDKSVRDFILSSHIT